MPVRYISEIDRRPPERRNANVTRYRVSAPRFVRDVPQQAPPILTKIELDFGHAIAEDRDRKLLSRTPRTAEEIERSNNVPIKVIKDEARKPRRIMTGKFVRVEEVGEVFAALGQLPAGHSMEVTLSDSTLKNLKQDGAKNPARSLVNVFRRRFASGGLPYDAYASDDKTITITREKPKAEATKKK